MSDDVVIISEDDLNEILRRLDQGRNAADQSMFFINLTRQNPTIDYAWIETRLRSIGCENLYLLALPLATAPQGMRVKALFDRFEARYWIWHSVNGREERAATMVEHGIPMDDDARNLENLKLAGNLVVG